MENEKEITAKKEINLPEIAQMVADDPRITAHPDTVEDVLRVAFEKIPEVSQKDRVEIHRFGVFEFRRMEAKTVHGIDGMPHEVPPMMVLKFRASEHQKHQI